MWDSGELIFLKKKKKKLMRDLIDQNHANWIIIYQIMEKEWEIQALCGEAGDRYSMVSMVEYGRIS